MTRRAEMMVGNLMIAGKYDVKECPDTKIRYKWRFQYSDERLSGTHVSCWFSSPENCEEDAKLRGLEFRK